MTTEGRRRLAGRTLEDALDRACAELGARLEELRYDVVEEGGGEVVLEVDLDPVAVVGLFLAEITAAGGLDLRAGIESREGVLEGELRGEDLRLLTAAGGRGLDALQYLSNRVLSRRLRTHPPIHLDGEGFKARRAGRLREQAREAAKQARRRRSPVSIGPLTPAARREVHLALADDPAVETESDGNGFLKHVVVRPLRR